VVEQSVDGDIASGRVGDEHVAVGMASFEA
jgi:hypothetical protein